MSMYPTMDYSDFSSDPGSVYEDLFDDVCPSASLAWSSTYLPALYFLIFFAGVSGNVFVIVVMRGKRKVGRLVDTFVLHLAVADLVFVCTLPLWGVSALQEHRWAFGDALCKVSSYVIAVNRFSNIIFLTCMSADRYLAVVRVLDSRTCRTARRVRLTCWGVWALSLTLGAPSLVFRRVEELEDGGGSFCVEEVDSPAFQALSLASFFLAFALPVLVILFCYGSILVRLRTRARPGKAQAEARRRHSLKIVFAIVTAFVLSWLPFNVFKTALIATRMQGEVLSCWATSLLAKGLVLSSCLAFFNSCANPAIYLFLDQHFRRRARGLCLGQLGTLGLRRRRASSSSLSFGTSDTCPGSATTRTRLFSVTQNE